MKRKSLLSVLLATLVLASMVAPAVAMGGSLNYDSGEGPNPYYSITDLTIDQYRVSDGGALVYQNDNSEWVEFPGVPNTSDDHGDLGNGHVNAWKFKSTDINESSFGEFPRKDAETGDNDASALDASEYTTGANATVSDVTTAPSVDAVEFNPSSAGSKNDNTATYSNFSITSDAEKRYFIAAYDIDSASASVVNVTVHDATDGDTAVIEVYNSSASTTDTAVGANSTGEGKLMQVQLGDVSVSGGDGTLNEIGKIVFNADGAANVDFSQIELEKTGQYDFGTEYHDDDNDDELETRTVRNATGEIQIKSISSMGSTFDDADIRGLDVPVRAWAANQADADVQAEFMNGADEGYPNWDQVLDVTYRMELPNAFDLSYANVELRLNQSWPESRYVVAEYAEGVGDSKDVEDIDDSSYSSFSSSLGSVDSEVDIDTTISPGDDNVVHLKLTLTDSEANAMQAASGGGGGGGGLFGGGGGGFWSFITSPFSMLMAALGGGFAWWKRGGS